MNVDRLPPQNLEAERAVLGSMLRDNLVIDDVLNVVRAEDFYTDAHQKVFAVIADIHELRQPVDLVFLAEALRGRNQLADIGGYGFLGELWDAAPTAANAEYYAGIVRDKATSRRVIHAATEIVGYGYGGMPSGELLEKAGQSILGIAEGLQVLNEADIGEAATAACDEIDHRYHKRKSCGVPTFDELDRNISGLQPGNLIIVAARPSIGKTSFAMSLALQVAKRQRGVLFLSLEQSKDELAERALCHEARVSSHKVRNGWVTNDEAGRLAEARQALSALPVHLVDGCAVTLQRCAWAVRRYKRKRGIAVAIVDYLGLIEPRDRRQSRYEQVSEISRGLKAIARETNLPLVVLAQLNRENEKRKDHRPQLSDLRDSGSIEQDADLVLLLHRADVYEEVRDENTSEAEVFVAKQRNGPTGTIKLAFQKQYMRFEDMASPEATSP